MSKPFVLVLEFHLGRFGIVEACEAWDVLREAGVGVIAALPLEGVGDPIPDGLGIEDFRPVKVAVT